MQPGTWRAQILVLDRRNTAEGRKEWLEIRGIKQRVWI
jgi:hypothetical protein